MPQANKAVLRSLFELADQAQTVVSHTPAGFQEPTSYRNVSARRSAVINLTGEFLPDLIAKDGRHARAPRGTLAGQTTSLDAALINASRVAQAGALVIVMPDADKAVATGLTGGVILHKRPGAFVIVDPANYSTVEDDDETPTSPALPIHREAISWDNAITKGFRVTVTRGERRTIEGAEFEAQAMSSLIMGMARACDEVLMDKIATGTPAAFSLAAAAAQGLKIEDLRGLVGTAGAGGVIAQDGALRLAGIAAELTDAVTGSYVGAFQQAAVAVHPDVTIIAERIKKNGDLELQAFISLIPLTPAPGRFWSVAA